MQQNMLSRILCRTAYSLSLPPSYYTPSYCRCLQYFPPSPTSPHMSVCLFPGQNALLKQQPPAWLWCIFLQSKHSSFPTFAIVPLRQCETCSHRMLSCFEHENEPGAFVIAYLWQVLHLWPCMWSVLLRHICFHGPAFLKCTYEACCVSVCTIFLNLPGVILLEATSRQFKDKLKYNPTLVKPQQFFWQ